VTNESGQRAEISSAFTGGLVDNHNLNGVTEWAYGVTDWFEAGLYLAWYSYACPVRGCSHLLMIRVLITIGLTST
jgi:hypothetical protein